jgi:hypothetical protein
MVIYALILYIVAFAVLVVAGLKAPAKLEYAEFGVAILVAAVVVQYTISGHIVGH